MVEFWKNGIMGQEEDQRKNGIMYNRNRNVGTMENWNRR
jgi:hypothetical protein